MEMHCKLLGTRFPEEITTASVSDLIKSMVGGKATHRASALKLALKTGRSTGSILVPSLFVPSSPEYVYYEDTGPGIPE